MKIPRVSVILGTYNCAKYIEDTLASVFSQTYTEYEVVVVDDASTDHTVDILRKYGKQIRLYSRDQNSGVCGVTKNDGMKLARGELYAFQDADDLWYPEKLEKQVAFFDAHPQVPFCHTYTHIIDPDSKVLCIRHEGNLPPTGRVFKELLEHCFITICTVMVRRSLIDEIGGFADDPVFGREAEDLHFFLRVAKRYPIGLVPEVLAGYRRGVTTSMAAMKGWKSMPAVPMFSRLLLKHRELWEGATTRREVLDCYLRHSRENAIYWRDNGYALRSLYFCIGGLLFDPLAKEMYFEAERSLASLLFRRGKMAKRRKVIADLRLPSDN